MNKLINIQKKTAHTILQMAQQYDLGTLLDAVSLVFSNVTFLTGEELGDLFSEYTQQHYLSSSGDDPAADFISTLLRYWDFRKTDYYKMFTTLSSDYDPIENYSMTERGSDGKRLGKQTITETPSGSESVASTYSGTKSTTATGTKITTVTPEGGTTTTETPSGTSSVTETETAGRTVTATTSRTTFDDTTNYKPVEKVETSDVPNTGYERNTETSYNLYSIETHEQHDTGSKTTTNESYNGYGESESFNNYGHTDTKSFNGRNDKRETEYLETTSRVDQDITGAEVNDHVFTRSGNIGVTTAQQMIESEIKLRYWHNLQYMFITEFIRKFTF